MELKHGVSLPAVISGMGDMTVHFVKYHGLGNDYLVIDPSVYDIDMTEANIRLICDRNFGIGSDGILYGPAFEGDMPLLRIFNPDGSEAEKSGNGLRIFAKYLFEKKYVMSKDFRIKTLGGIVDIQIKDGPAGLIRINMGKVTFLSHEIPVAGERREVVNEPLNICGAERQVTCLSIGNPHCVILMQQVSEQTARELGPHVERHCMFPNRINMQIVRVIDRANIEIRIWERGAGYTLASGSSSCAAAAAVHKLNLVDDNVTVHMPGGALQIEMAADGQIRMTGPVEGIFEGCFHQDLQRRIAMIE
jgi:diaminopimelate epimerase